MKKETFLRQLCRRLNRLKREERVQVIESFREMISDRMEEGLSEEEAVACLGTPKEAAQEILNGMPEEKLLKKDRLGPVLLILFLIAGGLSLFWAVRIRSHFPASVAVIGGADGPTSIFVAAKLGHAWGLYAAAVLLLLALAVHLWRRSRM